MQISSIKSKIYNSCQKLPNNIPQKARLTLNKLEQQKSPIYTPIKYYLIGLAIPIPFASTVGLAWGLGVVAKQKLAHIIKKNKTS